MRKITERILSLWMSAKQIEALKEKRMLDRKLKEIRDRAAAMRKAFRI